MWTLSQDIYQHTCTHEMVDVVPHNSTSMSAHLLTTHSFLQTYQHDKAPAKPSETHQEVQNGTQETLVAHMQQDGVCSSRCRAIILDSACTSCDALEHLQAILQSLHASFWIDVS